MRFSLSSILIIITIAALTFLLFREIRKTELFEENLDKVNADIAAMDPHLRNDLPFYRDSLIPDKGLEEVHATVIKKFDRTQEQRIQKEISDLKELAVFHLPVLETGRRFAIYVPGKDTHSLRVYAGSPFSSFGDAKTDNMFSLDEPIELDLEQGLNTIEFRKAEKVGEVDPKAEFRMDPNEEPRVYFRWQIMLNDDEIGSVNGALAPIQSDYMVWLTSKHQFLSTGTNNTFEFQKHVVVETRPFIFASINGFKRIAEFRPDSNAAQIEFGHLNFQVLDKQTSAQSKANREAK